MNSPPSVVDSLFFNSGSAPPLICVEMSGNHQGSLDAAIRFVRMAKEAGADLLKVQVYRPDTITIDAGGPDFRLAPDNDWSRYETLYSLYQKAHTPWDWIAEMFAEAKAIGLPIFASPFDLSAVHFLEDLGCPLYKIASPEITDIGLIEACAKTGKPVVLSTGLASREDLDEAVSVLKTHKTPFVILKCVSAYPTPIDDMNLSSIPWLKEIYGCGVGLSDHSVGTEACLAAAALGAVMIEKHFRLPEDSTSVDSAFSMSLDALAALKASVLQVYRAVGRPTLDIPDIARPSLSGRRSLYAVDHIKAGEVFTIRNVRSVRPSFGLHPRHLNDILGRRATAGLAPGDRISWDIVD